MANLNHCVWFDLFVENFDKAKLFYSELFNWQVGEQEISGQKHTIFKIGDKGVGALGQAPHSALNNQWVAYVEVNNAQEMTKSIQKNGGKILKDLPLPGIGHCVYATDPDGAIFAVYESAKACEASVPTFPVPVGQFCWHELMCRDYKTALKFYSSLFGWEKATAMDMGPMGVYQVYAHGKQPLGGMMDIQPNMGIPPCWVEYVHVDDVDATVSRAQRLGGRAGFPAMDVGDGSGRIAGIIDNQGVGLALWTEL